LSDAVALVRGDRFYTVVCFHLFRSEGRITLPPT
jgi:hypothetical protein